MGFGEMMWESLPVVDSWACTELHVKDIMGRNRGQRHLVALCRVFGCLAFHPTTPRVSRLAMAMWQIRFRIYRTQSRPQSTELSRGHWRGYLCCH